MLEVDISNLDADGNEISRLITFEGSPKDLGDAFVIDPEGWGGDDAPSVRRESAPRSSRHGSTRSPGYRDGIIIPVSGWIIASSPGELQHSRNLLAGILADGDYGRMTVRRPLGEMWIDVGLNGTPAITVSGGSECEATFYIEFWAPNPRWFGDVNTFAAGEEAVHRGNFKAAPVLVVTGPHPGGYTITAGADQFTVISTLGTGSVDEIDMATGRVYRNGELLIGGMGRADTWQIPPGLPGVVHTITGNASSLTVRVTDTFI